MALVDRRFGGVVLVALCLLVGLGLRFVGLERGASDFAASGEYEYYYFHPDEATLVRAALAPIDPFDPPFTAYGLLPVYVLRTALWAQGLAAADLEVVDQRQQVFVTARAIAALLSTLVLWMTWVVGMGLARADIGRGGTALLGLVFVAFAPGAIQQGHFFIVDGFFTAISLVGIWAILRAVQSAEWRWYLLAGLLVGALGAVRFNGLILGLVLLVGHLLRPGVGRWRRLRAPELWLAGGAALALVLALQPYLWANPSLLSRVDTNADFALSLRFARLEFLQPWTLVDVHGTRYWDHWFGLWPWIVGWPLMLALLVGVGAVAWRGNLLQRLALLWCGLYFLSMGALPVKAVRYLVPLLPLLGCCAAAWCMMVWRRQCAVGAVLIVVLVGYTAVYGLAFARIYTTEDSRIQAGRWIAAEVLAGSRVGMETGAFNLRSVVDPTEYEHQDLGVSGLFYGSAYMLCGQQVDYLRAHLLAMDWLALVDENRAVQFRAVPELFPVVDDFYTRLFAGKMGFAPVRRFVVEPEFMGLSFADRDAEPSFLAYDHPAVQIFRREEGAAGVLAAWREAMGASAACADRALWQVAEALESGAADPLPLALQLPTRYPHSALGHLLVAEAHWRRGDEASGEAAYQRYRPEQASGRMHYLRRSSFRHYAPGHAALACVELGLVELALRVLRSGMDEVQPAGEQAVLEMAESYLKVGQTLLQRGRVDEMVEVLSLSLEIRPHKVAYNVLATTAFEQQDYPRAVALWQHSLALDEAQDDTHATLGQVLLAKRAAPGEALVHLQRAIELDPARAAELEKWIAAARAELVVER